MLRPMSRNTERLIYTLTPNPALDLSGHVPRILLNEKNYVTKARRDPGGNGINAARIIQRLGGRVVTFGFIGGSTGDALVRLVKGEGISTRFTPIKNTTRVNVTVTNDKDHQQTRLTFPGPSISQTEIKALENQIRKIHPPGILVMGGSLPQGCSGRFYPRVVRAASAQGLQIVVDAPVKYLRAILATKGTRLLLIKPNEVEFEELCGKKLRGERAIAREAMKFARQVEFVCVSLGERGAILATSRGAWVGRPPKVKARGSVGAGDSMVGAMAMKLTHDIKSEDHIVDAFAWGLAAGTATAEAEGTAMANAGRVKELTGKTIIRKLEMGSRRDSLLVPGGPQ